MTPTNSRYASIRNLAHWIAHVRAASYARVGEWNERSSMRAEQRLNRLWRAFGNVNQKIDNPGGRRSR
jgi:hypothetical protein